MRTFSKVFASALLVTTFAGLTATIASANFLDSGKIAPWAYDAVLEARNSGIMQGGTDNNFRPLDAITRQEAAAILVKLLELDTTASTKITFSDVTANDWGWKQIEAVKHAGVMLGDGAVFRPNDKITREELAVLLVKAADIDPAGQADALTVADHKKISSWAKAYVQTAIEKKLMRGDGTNFNPQSQATRQEVAVMAANFTALVGAPQDPTAPQPEPGTTPEPTQPSTGTGTDTLEDLTSLNNVIRNSPTAQLLAALKDESFQHLSSFEPTQELYMDALLKKQYRVNRDLTRVEMQQTIDVVNVLTIEEVVSSNDPAGLIDVLKDAGITYPQAVLADLYMQGIDALPTPKTLADIQRVVTIVNTGNAALVTALTSANAALDADDAAALLTALQGVPGLPSLQAENADYYLSELAMEREFNRGYALNKSIIARVIEATNLSVSSN
ncbi:hypothetical protein CBW65_02695 [Tumebacillus avium]|uniref:SLH domain-containing protein n=1 Tax=Tumebacillus avium TaxID=1903704 RepID=A0A1Y0IKW7_9BACL|nr:S-layer homology domain-containing protein [Tumebacillus avium]ARU60083.1 hypothetical protein CBW65_02695 [Tumebacillus avium]